MKCYNRPPFSNQGYVNELAKFTTQEKIEQNYSQKPYHYIYTKSLSIQEKHVTPSITKCKEYADSLWKDFDQQFVC